MSDLKGGWPPLPRPLPPPPKPPDPPMLITEVITRQKVNHHWLKFKREQAGIKQWVLAMQLGITAPYLGTIERGVKPCPEWIRAEYAKLVINHVQTSPD